MCRICEQPELALDVDGKPMPLVHYVRQMASLQRHVMVCRLCSLGIQAFRDSPVLIARALGLLVTTEAHPYVTVGEAQVRVG